MWFDEVDEAYSTQTCSWCKKRTGRKGQEGFGIREWARVECGAYHQRGREHSRGGRSPSCRRNARLFSARRSSRRLRAEGEENGFGEGAYDERTCFEARGIAKI
ncbi:zinc ribbon domain-containing protein [Paraburkholderia dipogonis]|uniref:zinc ribbon domain-containing protein n=1 Tax=Paraburkholderia dipogonis TaxID=1211383 RepID=UPI00406B9F87